MTSYRILLAIFGVVAQLTSSTAFSARSVSRLSSTSTSTASRTTSSTSRTTSTTPSRIFQLDATASSISEQEAAYMMAKARECAFSDSCSIEESNARLHDVLNIQVACASGTVAGHDICDDQLEATEIVARLRDHVKSGKHGLTARQQALQGLLPIAFFALTCASMVLAGAANPNVDMITPQEILWAARDGYLDDLVHHFMTNGGLLVSDANIIPLTNQEWMMAARGGYLDDMIHHWMQNGGL